MTIILYFQHVVHFTTITLTSTWSQYSVQVLEVMDGGKVDAVLRFALATLSMRQGQPPAGCGVLSDVSVAAEGAGLVLGADGASDWGFEPGQSDVDTDVDVGTDLDGQQAEDGTREAVLDVVVGCMGRLRGVCEDSEGDEDRGERVDKGFRDAARELRGHSERHGRFGELLSLLVELLRAADTEGETMDAASLSHGAKRTTS